MTSGWCILNHLLVTLAPQMRICADESERTKAKITKQDWNQNNRLSNKIEIRIKTNLYLLYKLGCGGRI